MLVTEVMQPILIKIAAAAMLHSLLAAPWDMKEAVVVNVNLDKPVYKTALF